MVYDVFYCYNNNSLLFLFLIDVYMVFIKTQESSIVWVIIVVIVVYMVFDVFNCYNNNSLYS
jgi:hypothetical protein